MKRRYILIKIVCFLSIFYCKSNIIFNQRNNEILSEKVKKVDVYNRLNQQDDSTKKSWLEINTFGGIGNQFKSIHKYFGNSIFLMGGLNLLFVKSVGIGFKNYFTFNELYGYINSGYISLNLSFGKKNWRFSPFMQMGIYTTTSRVYKNNEGPVIYYTTFNIDKGITIEYKINKKVFIGLELMYYAFILKNDLQTYYTHSSGFYFNGSELYTNSSHSDIYLEKNFSFQLITTYKIY